MEFDLPQKKLACPPGGRGWKQPDKGTPERVGKGPSELRSEAERGSGMRVMVLVKASKQSEAGEMP
jgi:hypothetical protein